LSSNSSNLESYFLPAPSAFIKHISFVQPNKTIRYLIEELFDEYICNEYFLILYGDKLMKFFIENDKDVRLRKLCNRCVKLVFESNESPPNIQLIQIISKSLTKISERNQPFFDDFIIRTSFLWVFDNSYLEASLEEKIRLKHLSYYGSYSKLSKSTYIDSLIDKIYGSILRCKFLNNKYINLSNIIRWYNRYSYDKLTIYEIHLKKLHQQFRYINSINWNKSAKPNISNVIKNVLLDLDSFR
ncbi:10536_t:CDS:2, partial [Gigaspora margarita]